MAATVEQNAERVKQATASSRAGALATCGQPLAMSSSLFFLRARLALLALPLLALPVRAENVFVDSFDDGDPSLADSQPGFWTVLRQDGNNDSTVTEAGGSLRLRAATWPNTYVALVSQALEDFGFFTRPVTVTLEDITLDAKGIEPGEARFKLSLSSKPERAERAEDVISLRVRPGLLLLGYRVDGFDLGSGPETLSGKKGNSVLVQELSAMPKRISLTLGPAQTPGSVRFDISADGNGVSVNRSGVFPLSLAEWGRSDSAAISIDARRDSTTAKAGTHTELSVGKITVTR